MTDSFKYYAFISYSHADLKWGKRLERKLAGYKMPATLCSERGWKRKPINPIFFAPYDIQPGDLDEELKARLRASRNLIVICSPDSAQSEWVGKEIRYFHELGRDKHIFFFIVRGEPHSQDPALECFNPIVHELDIPEILGANIHDRVYRLSYFNKQRAYVQLISKLLEVEFDSIWKRHKRLLLWHWAAYFALAILFVAGICLSWTMNKDTMVNLSLYESIPTNSQLPPLQDMIVSVFLDQEQKTDTIHAVEDTAIFHHVPMRYINHPLRITVSHSDFTSSFREIDTTVLLTPNMSIPVQRDTNEYGDIQLQVVHLKSDKAIRNMMVLIDGDTTYTDDSGELHYHVPYAKQAAGYQLYIPQFNHYDSVFMPSQEDGVILVK